MTFFTHGPSILDLSRARKNFYSELPVPSAFPTEQSQSIVVKAEPPDFIPNFRMDWPMIQHRGLHSITQEVLPWFCWTL